MYGAYFLNVGRADCSVLFLDTHAGKKTIVIDGGAKYYDQKSVLHDFLSENGIAKIDLLILTHLHQDHFGGFYHLINKISIEQAVIPYGDIIFHPYVSDYYENHEFFSEYHAFYQYLIKIGTQILRPEQCADLRFYFGDFSLSCLYPLKETAPVQDSLLNRLCSDDLRLDEAQDLSLQFRSLINESSSIWLLQKNSSAIILFSGDCTADAMDNALANHPASPRILKLSHHGINKRYFSDTQLKLLNPNEIIISNTIEMKEAIYKDAMPLLPSRCKVVYTWDGNYSAEF